jgi:hypothetical protein
MCLRGLRAISQALAQNHYMVGNSKSLTLCVWQHSWWLMVASPVHVQLAHQHARGVFGRRRVQALYVSKENLLVSIQNQ